MNKMNKLEVQSPIDSEPLDILKISINDRDRLIISTVKVDTEWVILSQFGDNLWKFIPSTSNNSTEAQKIDFLKLPVSFRNGCKAIFYRYIRRGYGGGVRPKTSTVIKQFAYTLPFIRHLHQLKINSFKEITPLVCSTYVQTCKNFLQKNKKNKPLSSTALMHRFLAVEMLYELSQFSEDPMPTHPWIDTSAIHIAGLTGIGRGTRTTNKTPLIPDEIFSILFQKAWDCVKAGDEVLDLRDQLDLIGKENSKKSISQISRIKNKYLKTQGRNDGLEAFNDTLRELSTASYIVVASLSGCRNHELAFIQSNACYSTKDDKGGIYWWFRSQSIKTDSGYTVWMIPEAAVEALRIMDRWAVPYQKMIAEEIETRRTENPLDLEITHAQSHLKAVFLGVQEGRNFRVRTLTALAWKSRFKVFMKRHNINWELNSHQFRRKFANYVARSKFGDLRYLREHFKHWSMDMTLGYALNEYQEMTLFLEIEEELALLKTNVVQDWLNPNKPLSGGYGKNIASWRGNEAITIFKNHQQMVKSISESTAIRSNGHAWCTADDNLCVGNDIDVGRCGGCDNAVITTTHAPIYQGLYDHLKEVLLCNDIGTGGMARVTRDIARCRKVLMDLGHDPEASAA